MEGKKAVHTYPPEPPEESQYYTLEEACTYLDISIQTLRKYIDSGELPARQLGRKMIILKKELSSFLLNLPLVQSQQRTELKDFRNKNDKLIEAAHNGHTATVQELIADGADVNATDKDGWTALMLASWQGHTETVRALTAAKANVNARNKDGWTALMNASRLGHTEIVQGLITAKADVNAKDKDGYTALMFASSNGHTDIVKALN